MLLEPVLGTGVSDSGLPSVKVEAGPLPASGVAAGFWLFLAGAGQFAALRMIDAGKLIHYQHYRPEQHPFLLAIIALQTLAVAIGLANHHTGIASWVRRNLRAWQVIAIAFFSFAFAVALSRDVPGYLAELAFGSFVQLLSLLTIALFAATLPVAAVSWIQRRWGRSRPILFGAVWVAVVSAFLSAVVYERHPHLEDEAVYLNQARFLAAGHLTLPAPPVPAAFETYLMDVQNGRWFPTPPAGWPAVLAIGVLLGVPWLVNPVLAGLNVLLAYLLMRELYQPRAARICVVFLCISPWYLMLSMSFMPHLLSLAATLLAALGVAWSRSTGSARWGWMAGIAAGVVSLIRPLEGAVVLALLGLWAIGLGGRRLRPAALAGMVAGAALTAALVLPYNEHLTGDPKVFPLMAYTDRVFGKNSNALGFGPDRGRGFGWALDPYPGHGWRDVLVNSELNAFGLNTELLGWSCGSLLLAAFAVFAGKLRRSDWLMLAAAGGVFIAHAFYWFSGGPDFGARYWFLMLVPLLALTARGVEELQERPDGTRVIPAILALSAFAILIYLPWRATDKYYGYLRMRPEPIRLAQQHHFGRSLVLIRGTRFPDYASASAYNPLNLAADVPIYVWDKNPGVRKAIVRAYPGRPVWMIDGPSVSSNGHYQIQAGPLRSDDFMLQ